MAPPFVQPKGATPPSDSPGPPRRTPGEAVTRLAELLAQLDLAAHGDGALGGDRPALAATLRRAAAQLERRGVEERRARLRRVGDDPPPPVRIAREVHEQRRRERPVHDEARIALDVHRPRAVVVNAVAV